MEEEKTYRLCFGPPITGNGIIRELRGITAPKGWCLSTHFQDDMEIGNITEGQMSGIVDGDHAMPVGLVDRTPRGEEKTQFTQLQHALHEVLYAGFCWGAPALICLYIAARTTRLHVDGCEEGEEFDEPLYFGPDVCSIMSKAPDVFVAFEETDEYREEVAYTCLTALIVMYDSHGLPQRIHEQVEFVYGCIVIMKLCSAELTASRARTFFDEKMATKGDFGFMQNDFSMLLQIASTYIRDNCADAPVTFVLNYDNIDEARLREMISDAL